MLLGQGRPQRRQGHPGLDGDRHVGGRVVDQAVDRPGVDGHARPGRDAAVVHRGAPAPRVDRTAPGHLVTDQLAERVNVVGPEVHEGRSAVADGAAGREVGGDGLARSRSSRWLHSGAAGVAAALKRGFTQSSQRSVELRREERRKE